MVRCHRTVSQLTNEAVNADLTTARVIDVPVVVVLVLAEFSFIGTDITLQPRVVRTRGMNHNTLNGDFATCRRVVGRKARKYVDTDIQFLWLSRIKLQNHRYHYTEHLFVCQGLNQKNASILSDVGI